MAWEIELSYRLREYANRIEKPHLFPVLVAVALYNKYATRILDFCAGWGDRLLAACATQKEYVGVDSQHSFVQRPH